MYNQYTSIRAAWAAGAAAGAGACVRTYQAHMHELEAGEGAAAGQLPHVRRPDGPPPAAATAHITASPP